MIKTEESEKFFNFLLEKKILIKNLSKMKGLKNYLRITIGSQEDNSIFSSALDEFFS
jgi:histidinol-phosphate/aromatic aminotransferase/cobyric acid decarboxylase-like protein